MTALAAFLASRDGAICILIFSGLVLVFLIVLAIDTLVIGPHGSPNPYEAASYKARNEVHVVDHYDNGSEDTNGVYHRGAVDIRDGVRKGKR